MFFVMRPETMLCLTAAVSRKQYEATELSSQSTVIVEADAWINKDRLLRLMFIAVTILGKSKSKDVYA